MPSQAEVFEHGGDELRAQSAAGPRSSLRKEKGPAGEARAARVKAGPERRQRGRGEAVQLVKGAQASDVGRTHGSMIAAC